MICGIYGTQHEADEPRASDRGDELKEVLADGIELYRGDCREILPTLEGVDLTVTSPPYDDLRTYRGSLNDWGDNTWRSIIRGLWDATSGGGVVTWVVADATINGSETGTSFRQALYALECGFRLHDTMIWNKGRFTAVGALASRYAPVFEYMFIWSKEAPKTFNPIKDRKNKHAGTTVHGTIRCPDGTVKPMSTIGNVIPELGQRFNIWNLAPEQRRGKHHPGHPAPFPEVLAADHIHSWSNPRDVVLDPFLGSGTTGIAAVRLGRKFIGIELEPTYFDIACKRISEALKRAKISATKKGQKPHLNWLKAVKEANTGRKHTSEEIERRIAPRRGRMLSALTRARMRAAAYRRARIDHEVK